MDCSRVEQLAETYGLGQLSHSTMAALEEHAAHCLRCEARLLACTGLGGELDDALMAMAEPSRGLLSRIYDSMPVQGVAESNLCYSLGPQLSALVDGELAGEDGLRVTEHLESCEYCARRLQALEEQAGVLATVREEPSARCAARLARLVESHSLRRVAAAPWWRRVATRSVTSMAAAVAGVLVVFLAGWGASQLWSASKGIDGSPDVSLASAQGSDGEPLVRSLPVVGLDETERGSTPVALPAAHVVTRTPPRVVRVAARTRGRTARSAVAVRADVERGSSGVALSVTPTTSPAAEPNRADGSSDLINRAWVELIGSGAQKSEAPAPPPPQPEQAHGEDLFIVEAVTVEQRGGPYAGEYLEPSVSAVLY